MIICDECKNSGSVTTFVLTIKDKKGNNPLYNWEIDLCENCRSKLSPHTFMIGLEALRKQAIAK